MLRAIRRSLIALGAAGIIAAYIKTRAGDATPPQEGGWRELSGPEFK